MPFYMIKKRVSLITVILILNLTCMKHLKQIMVLLALVVAMVGCDKEAPIPAPTGYIKIDNTTLQNGIQATIINNGVTDDVQNVTYTLYVDMTTLTDNTTGYNSAWLTLEKDTQGSTDDYAETFLMDEDSIFCLTKSTVRYIRADVSRVSRVCIEGDRKIPRL